MIAANGVTARYLTSRGVPSLRRVLANPKHWDRIVALAAERGETLPARPSAQALNAFLTERRQIDPAGFADLSLCVIKLLGRGEYALDLPGQNPSPDISASPSATIPIRPRRTGVFPIC